MTFLSTLLALDKAATPGPWEWIANQDGYPTELTALGVGVLRPGIAVSPTDGGLSAYITNDSGSAEPGHPDFALIAALRNSAARLAAVIDAASMMPVGPAMEDEPGPYVYVPKDDLRALRDALYELDKE